MHQIAPTEKLLWALNMRWDITTELTKTKTTKQNIMQIDYGRLAT